MCKIIKVLGLFRALGGEERGEQKAQLSRFQTPSWGLLGSRGILILIAFPAAGIKEQKTWAEMEGGLQDPGLAGAGLREGALGWGEQQKAAVPSQSPPASSTGSLSPHSAHLGAVALGNGMAKPR